MIENYNNVRAVLNELRQALKQLRETGATYSIYIEKTGLAEEEQVEVLETLGRGHITITFNETDHPAAVTQYAAIRAFDEDMVTAEEDLTTWIDAAGL